MRIMLTAAATVVAMPPYFQLENTKQSSMLFALPMRKRRRDAFNSSLQTALPTQVGKNGTKCSGMMEGREEMELFDISLPLIFLGGVLRSYDKARSYASSYFVYHDSFV